MPPIMFNLFLTINEKYRAIKKHATALRLQPLQMLEFLTNILSIQFANLRGVKNLIFILIMKVTELYKCYGN